MSNPNGRKGSDNEFHIGAWWEEQGYTVRYPRRRGANDPGDIHLVDVHGEFFLIEAKDWVTFDLPKWLRELRDELETTGIPTGAVMFKPRGTRDVGRYYALMDGELLERTISQ